MSDRNGMMLLWDAVVKVEGNEVEALINQANGKRNLPAKAIKSRESPVLNGKKNHIPIRHSHNELEKSRRAHLRSCMDKLKKVLKFDQDSLPTSRVTMLNILKQASCTIKNRERAIYSMSVKENAAKNRFVELTNRSNNLERQLKRIQNMQPHNTNLVSSRTAVTTNPTNSINQPIYQHQNSNSSTNSTSCSSYSSNIGKFTNNLFTASNNNINHSSNNDNGPTYTYVNNSNYFNSLSSTIDRNRNYSECSILTTSSDESNGDSIGRSRKISTASISSVCEHLNLSNNTNNNVNNHIILPLTQPHINDKTPVKSKHHSTIIFSKNYELSKPILLSNNSNNNSNNSNKKEASNRQTSWISKGKHNLIFFNNENNTLSKASSNILYKCSSPNSNSCDSGFEENGQKSSVQRTVSLANNKKQNIINFDSVIKTIKFNNTKQRDNNAMDAEDEPEDDDFVEYDDVDDDEEFGSDEMMRAKTAA